MLTSGPAQVKTALGHDFKLVVQACRSDRLCLLEDYMDTCIVCICTSGSLRTDKFEFTLDLQSRTDTGRTCYLRDRPTHYSSSVHCIPIAIRVNVPLPTLVVSLASRVSFPGSIDSNTMAKQRK